MKVSQLCLQGPSDLTAKKEFVKGLKAKYIEIEALNKKWGSKYSSWTGLLESREKPNKKKAFKDLAMFLEKFVDVYFKTCRDAVKKHAPNNLYLGCRINTGNWRVSKAANKCCDVVSCNSYNFVPTTSYVTNQKDKPIMIGEFHFGAMDRGLLHPGTMSVSSQQQRGEAYVQYIQSVLEEPRIIGAHWFQFSDESVSGRFDGANKQIGFVDICDNPYPETINASRKCGDNLYEYRTKFRYVKGKSQQ